MYTNKKKGNVLVKFVYRNYIKRQIQARHENLKDITIFFAKTRSKNVFS